MYEEFYKIHLEKFKVNNGKIKSLCPFHDDTNPSLSVNLMTGQFNCFGCEQQGNAFTFAKALNIPMETVPGYDPLYEKNNGSIKGRTTNLNPKKKIIEEYDYQDGKGDLLYQSVRYEPKGFCQRRPDGKGGWIYNLDGVKRVPYCLPRLILAQEIYIVEGEKDVKTLQDAGYEATTCSGGAGKWREDYNQYFENKNVVIIPDNDAPGKNHAEDVARNLIKVANTVKIVDLPVKPKGDVSDYLSKHTPDDLAALVDTKAIYRDDGEQKKPDTTLNLKKAPPSPQLADDLMGETIFLFMGEQLYVYQSGIYVKSGELFAKKKLKETLGNRYKKHIGEEVIHNIEIETHMDANTFQPPSDFINLKNGLFHLESGKLQSHDPKIVFLNQLPIVYDPLSKCPNIDRYLNTTLPSDCIELAEEIFGYCMIPHVKYQTAFMLTGEGENGKGTFINLLEAFLAPENVSKIPLQELDEHRFKRADLYGKLVNAFADLDRRALKGTSYFKTIVAGDSIDAERKFKNPFYFRPYAKLIFSANEIPHTPDLSHAFFRRWVVIPFPNRFNKSRADINLLQKMTTKEELSGLFNRAVAGLTRLCINGEFSEGQSVQAAKDDYRKESDSSYSFLLETTIEGADYHVKKTELYLKYKEWCEDTGLRYVSRQKFNDRLQSSFNVQEWIKDGTTRCWKGIGLLND